jgi:uncharacterized sulfatase
MKKTSLLPAIHLLPLFFLAFGTNSCVHTENRDMPRPNILFVFIDDMGYGDLGCYGNPDVHTPNIDRMAEEGIRIDQFYVNAPICSPSRVAVSTGQYPSRWGITSYISSRADNNERGIRDHLALSAPFLAKNLQDAGYYTAHIGKWHMGGGRDVHDAPLITEYGFDASFTQFEGLGERYLATYETLDLKDSTRSLEKRSAQLGSGPVHWAKRENFTRIFVDRTLEAMHAARKAGKPFYINLWPDDIHTPLEPPPALRGDLSTKARFLGVMEEMDRQIGRLMDSIRNDPELSRNTLIIFTSDNGPDKAVNKAGVLKGYKTNLYEGGIREPFIAWWPSVIPEEKRGTINSATVLTGVDLPLVLLTAAGVPVPDSIEYDGENLFEAISGASEPLREKAIFWLRPPDRPGYDGDNDPDLAMRKGDYKLLMDTGRKNIQLYNIVTDMTESVNLVDERPEIADSLANELLEWFETYPHASDLEKMTY